MKKEFGFWFWVHILLFIPAYLSPILFDWRWILLVIIALQIQYVFIGGCVLTHLEMGKDKNETFVWYYLRKIFPGLNAAKIKFAVRFVMPAVVLIVALILQLQLGRQALIQFL